MTDGASAKEPWLDSMGPRNADRLRRQREWPRQRLRYLLEHNGDIAAWRNIDGLTAHYDVIHWVPDLIADGLVRADVPGGNDMTVRRELADQHRCSIRGQLALEAGYVERGGSIDGPAVQRLLEKELKIYRELMACVICRRLSSLRNLWICTSCHGKWRHAEYPVGDEYATFVRNLRWSIQRQQRADLNHVAQHSFILTRDLRERSIDYVCKEDFSSLSMSDKS